MIKTNIKVKDIWFYIKSFLFKYLDLLKFLIVDWTVTHIKITIPFYFYNNLKYSEIIYIFICHFIKTGSLHLQ